MPIAKPFAFVAAIACAVAVVVWGVAVSAAAPEPATQPAATRPAAFPQAWVGHWKGPMTVDSRAGRAEARMELVIAPTADAARYTWTIIYDGPQGRQERRYELVVVDAARGIYQIDEKNSIVLDASLLGDTLASTFSVAGQVMATTYRLAGDTLDVQIVSSPLAGKPTGGKGPVPDVGSHPPAFLQRAVLKKG